jgi:hypothetical protein
MQRFFVTPVLDRGKQYWMANFPAERKLWSRRLAGRKQKKFARREEAEEFFRKGEAGMDTQWRGESGFGRGGPLQFHASDGTAGDDPERDIARRIFRRYKEKRLIELPCWLNKPVRAGRPAITAVAGKDVLVPFPNLHASLPMTSSTVPRSANRSRRRRENARGIKV